MQLMQGKGSYRDLNKQIEEQINSIYNQKGSSYEKTCNITRDVQQSITDVNDHKNKRITKPILKKDDDCYN